MNTRFRAEHVGSLLRPPELLAARSAHAAGQIPLEELRRQEDQAILAALEKQRSIGLDVLSDGELRRGSWLTDMADAVEGFVPAKVTLEWKGPGGGCRGQHRASGGSEAAESPQAYRARIAVVEASGAGYVQSHAPRAFQFCLGQLQTGRYGCVLSHACRPAARPGGNRAR